MFGGAALNAAHALLEILDAVRPRNGRLPEELRPGIAAPTKEELADWTALSTGAEMLGAQGASPADAAAAARFYDRTWAEPAVDVHGIDTGSAHLQKTIVPSAAEANLSIRLAPGQDVEQVATAIEGLLREAVPPGADLEVTRLSTSAAGLIDPESDAVRVGLDAFERVLGVRPLLVRGGGTLPIVPALAAKGIPTILTGFDLPDGNAHSPNERLALDLLPLGVACARETLVALRQLD
jgi:acetylornithine deacetylase/succinyl-diaminopimelate desuccinylase-like protein